MRSARDNKATSSIIEMNKAKFLHAVKSQNSNQVNTLLQDHAIHPSTIYEYTDRNKKSALDYAIEKNDIELFTVVLSYLYIRDPQQFAIHLKKISQNKQGTTPLHLAANLGYAQFFKLLNDRKSQPEDKMWSIVRECWLNAADQNGNTPLHLAMQYHPKAAHDFIKRKKEVVKELIQIEDLDLGLLNLQGQTALSQAAQFGYFETAKILLRIYRPSKSQDKIEKSEEKNADKALLILDPEISSPKQEEIVEDKNKKDKKDKKDKKKSKSNLVESNFQVSKKTLLSVRDKNERSAADIATLEGHQRIYKSIYYYQNPKLPKQKSNSETLSYTLLETWAKNPNFSEEDFMTNLKAATSLSYKEVMSLIDLRVESLKKSYKRKISISTFFGSLCPAITAAAYLGSLGGFNPEPITVSLLTAAAFPVIFVPFVYVCYKTRMNEFSNTAKEAMRFNWLATKLPLYEKEFEHRLDKLEKEAKELNSQLDASNDSSLQAQVADLQKRHKELQEEMNGLIDFTNEGKAKLALSYIPRQDLKDKKQLGVADPKENKDWINSKEKGKAFIAYNTDIFCPMGAGLNIAAVATSIIMAKYGATVYGLTAAAGIGGPWASLAVGIVGTLVLTIMIGALIYKSSYQNEKQEMGAQNRSLVQAYDSCRIKTNKDDLKVQNQKVVSLLEQIKNKMTQIQSKFIAKKSEETPANNKSRKLKVSDPLPSISYESMEIEQKAPVLTLKQRLRQFFFGLPSAKDVEQPPRTPEMALHRHTAVRA